MGAQLHYTDEKVLEFCSVCSGLADGDGHHGCIGRPILYA